ncbi:MAG: hypothetical protein RIS52_1040 [Pseudomonadota bacterium]|jgi:Ni/Co efflux regulator RcnB
MRKSLIIALLATTLVPTASFAQSRDTGYGSRDYDARDAGRGERDEDRQDYRRDDRDDRYGARDDERGGWQGHRWHNRGDHRDQRGYGRRFVISDPWRYRLPATRGYTRWVRDRDDALLIDMRDGDVIKVFRHYFR